MSLLYKDKKDITTFVEINKTKEGIKLKFSADCGKFETLEILDMYTLSPERLLEILQEHENYTESELEYTKCTN